LAHFETEQVPELLEHSMISREDLTWRVKFVLTRKYQKRNNVLRFLPGRIELFLLDKNRHMSTCCGELVGANSFVLKSC